MSKTVADELRRVEAKFYHATQLQDFKLYCGEGAVLSRAELESADGAHTGFYTDDSDKEKGLWNRVFGNIEDFGRLFWNQNAGVPNAYGPITLVFDSGVWAHLDGIAVTERGAFHADFDLAEEEMSPEEIGDCFEEGEHKTRQIRWGLEVSSSSHRLPLSEIAYVLVDPISPGFVDVVREAASGCIKQSRIIERTLYGKPLDEGKRKLLLELSEWARELEGSPPAANQLASRVPESLAEWFDKVRQTQHGVLRQWLDYTYNGTLILPELNQTAKDS